MKIVPFEVVYPDINKISSPEEYIGHIRNQYPKYKKRGMFNKSVLPCIVVNRITDDKHSYVGFTALHAIEDMHLILGHENTLTTKEDNHVRQLLSNQSMIKPVLVGHDYNKSIADFLHTTITITADLTFNFEKINEIHELWFVADYTPLQEILVSYDQPVYIADGHHRYACYQYLVNQGLIDHSPFSGLLCTYMGFDQLKIEAYNRRCDLNATAPSDFIERLMLYGSIRETSLPHLPNQKHEIMFILAGQHYLFTWDKLRIPTNVDLVFDLDLFNQYIMAEIFNIDPQAILPLDHYVDGMMTIDAMIEDSVIADVAYAVFYPIDKDALKTVAMHHKILPPKSTWFLPRIKSGIINCDI